MKIPSSDNVKTVGIIILAGIGVYAAYRVFKVGSDAAGAVSATVGGAVDAVANAASTVYHAVIPNKPPPLAALPSNDNYPESAPIKYGQTHATPQEVNDYFNWNNGQYSPDAMGN